MLTVETLQKESHRIAREHGWWEHYSGTNKATEELIVMNKLMLVVSEIAEVVEEIRRGELDFDCIVRYNEDSGKPVGIAVELADAIIRIADLSEYLGVDLTEALLVKQIYNETRPWKHGGKKV